MSSATKICAACILLFLSTSNVLASDQKKPLTVAESSNFTATSRYADVLRFIEQLQQQSNFIRTETLCTSAEGRRVPLIILGNPVSYSPLDLKREDRAVVYIQANIHAGEVEGKEASLMLARDILHETTPAFLDRLVILIAPIFNADGNEKISPEHRRNQHGPEQGVGVRYNGQYLDLNRDCMKMESPEIRGMVQNVLMRWDPCLVIDCHTTNGSYHREPVTYSWPLNPNGDRDIISYMRDNMMPQIETHLEEKYETLSIPYGNFMDFRNPEKGWRTFGCEPRYVSNYIGLRNRLGILIENYAYADYITRVYGNYLFLLSILEYCYSHKSEIIRLVRESDQEMSAVSSKDSFAVTFDVKPLENPLTILGWEMEILSREHGWPRVKKKDIKRTYTLPYYANFVPERTVPLPYAYLIPVHVQGVKENLINQGIVVEVLQKPVRLEVEAFKLQEIEASERLYQGHRMNSVQGEYVNEEKEFPKRTLFIATAQPLGKLAAALLEPESDDGLLVWNFFDRYLVSQWRRKPQTYPVYQLHNPVHLVKRKIQKE